jgi:hypothetical protein
LHADDHEESSWGWEEIEEHGGGKSLAGSHGARWRGQETGDHGDHRWESKGGFQEVREDLFWEPNECGLWGQNGSIFVTVILSYISKIIAKYYSAISCRIVAIYIYIYRVRLFCN